MPDIHSYVNHQWLHSTRIHNQVNIIHGGTLPISSLREGNLSLLTVSELLQFIFSFLQSFLQCCTFLPLLLMLWGGVCFYYVADIIQLTTANCNANKPNPVQKQ